MGRKSRQKRVLRSFDWIDKAFTDQPLTEKETALLNALLLRSKCPRGMRWHKETENDRNYYWSERIWKL